MHHDLDLLLNLAVVLCVAFVGGYIARLLKAPTMAGYLLSGLAIGPFTPGFEGDIENIRQLTELGVIFMMFGVGLHFSLRDLWEVRSVAIPGAIAQISIATGLTWALTHFWQWTTSASLVVGTGALNCQYRGAAERPDRQRPAEHGPRQGRCRVVS